MTPAEKLGLTSNRAYLAGPMRGIKHYNFPAFEMATEYLRRNGWEIFSPAERDLEKGFDPSVDVSKQGFSLTDAFRADLDYIIHRASAIILLPKWRQSMGAIHEAKTAELVGLPLFEYYSPGGVGRITIHWTTSSHPLVVHSVKEVWRP